MKRNEAPTLHWMTVVALVACFGLFSWLALAESVNLLSAAVMVISLVVGLATFLLVMAWLCASPDGRSALLAGFLAAVRQDLTRLFARKK